MDETESVDDLDYRVRLQRKWKKRLEDRYPAYREYWNRAKKVVQRYEDERPLDREYTAGRHKNARRYNILWSNTATMQPMLFNKTPDPVVKRRWGVDDPVTRSAAEMLERVTTFNAQRDDVCFVDHMNAAVFNLLVPGTGVLWARYEVDVRVSTGGPDNQMLEMVSDQVVHADYVHYKDFMCQKANVWSQVGWVARRLWFTQDEIAQRWGPEAAQECQPERKDETDSDNTKSRKQECEIWEIWDKDTSEVLFYSRYANAAIEVVPDPLRLKHFFPCPKPLYAVWTTDDVIPIPVYCQYQDQAQELDDVTSRIYKLVKACKVVGAYNETMGADFQQMLTNNDNVMVPVTDWPQFQQTGSMAGNVAMLDLAQVVQMLQALVATREAIKEDINEITGMPDMFRGISSPLDAEGTNQLKVQWGASRTRDYQRDVQRFARDWMVISAEIIAEQFTPQNLVEMSGMNLPTSQEKQALQMQLQQYQALLAQAKATGMPPPPEPPQEMEERAQEASVEDVINLLRQDKMRVMVLDIESDSTIEGEDAKDREDRAQFIEVLTGMVERWGPIVAQTPQMLPMVKELVLFAIEPFRAGRSLEDEVERTFTALEMQARQAAKQPPEPQPIDKAMMADQQKTQMQEAGDTQREAMKQAGEDRRTAMKIAADREAREVETVVELATGALQP